MRSSENFISTTTVLMILQLTADSKASGLMLNIRVIVLDSYRSVTVGLVVFIVSPSERPNSEEGCPSSSCRGITSASLESTKNFIAD